MHAYSVKCITRNVCMYVHKTWLKYFSEQSYKILIHSFEGGLTHIHTDTHMQWSKAIYVNQVHTGWCDPRLID